MRSVLDVDTMRAADATAAVRVGEDALVARAGLAVATRVLSLLGGGYGRRVLVLAGSGHNGADALRAGEALARRGAHVHLVATSERAGDDIWRRAREGALAAGSRVLARAELPHWRGDVVIDGATGLGFTAAGEDRISALAGDVAATGACVVAVDVPSGVDANTGQAVARPVAADVTVTFTALKPGLLLGAGRDAAGDVALADVGIDVPPGALDWCAQLDADDVARLVPAARATDHKRTRGVLGVIAGSAAYPGAATLVCSGAVRAGAGFVRLLADERVGAEVRALRPEVVVTARPATGSAEPLPVCDAWVVGPGAGTDDESRALLARVLALDLPVLLDADALTLLAAEPSLLSGRSAPTVLTPHDGELARLLGPASDDRLAHLRAGAATLGVVLLSKGGPTVVADATGRVRIDSAGTPALATAGTGDVLAGIIGALLAQRVAPLDAAAAGAFLHGLAGRVATMGGGGCSALDVAEALPEALARVRAG